MKLPTFKRLNSGDYPQEQKSMMDQLSFIINNGTEVLYEALNKKLSFKDNFLATEVDIDVKVDSNGTPSQTLSAQTDFSGSARGVLVTQALSLDDPSLYPTGAPFISWSPISNGISIANIKGLPAGKTFRLRLVILG